MADHDSSRGTAPGKEEQGGGPTPPSAAGPEPRQIVFRVTRLTLLYRYLILFALTAVGVLLLYLLLPMALSGRDYLVAGLLALWALGLVRYWVFMLSMPYQLGLETDGSLALRSLFRTRRVPCKEIAALRVSPLSPSYLKIVTTRRKTHPMLNHVDGLHELIGRIKQIRPDLKTRGC